MILPLLPLFLVGPLAAPVWAVGLVEGVGEATAALLRGASGWWSDRARRRVPFVVAGYGLSSVVKPAFALVGSWPAALVARFLDRAGKGLRTAPRDALIAESVEPSALGRGYGLHRALDTAGAFAGAVIAVLLFAALVGRGGEETAFRWIFLLAGVPALAAVALLFLAVREPARHDAHAAARLRVRDALARRELRRFLVATGLLAFANVSFAFLLLAAHEAGASIVLALGLYAAANGVYAVLAFPAGALSDRWGRRRTLVAAFLLLAAVWAGLAVARDLRVVGALILGWGVFMAAFEGQAKAYAAELAPSDLKGTVLGLQTTTLGVLALPSGALTGWLWFVGGPAWAFGAAACFSIAAALALLVVPRR